ncbi:hypothetical protein J4G08_04795 [Candidatus Poribacteria bacterium]|nr:hypothetical protein [Candidatus Poribacteria bacterium]
MRKSIRQGYLVEGRLKVIGTRRGFPSTSSKRRSMPHGECPLAFPGVCLLLCIAHLFSKLKLWIE